MIRFGTHLNDARLHDHYLAERAGEACDLRTADHLGECADCAVRYHELTELLDEVREAGAIETSLQFSDAALELQRQQIFRRIEHASRPARVLSFPRQVTAQIAGASQHIASRWLVASAAAGLLVGVGLGGMLVAPGTRPADVAVQAVTSAPRAAAPPPSAARPVSSLPSATEPLDDDRFLLELEIALQRRTTRELLPFDTWTPQVREVGSRLR